MSILQDYFIKGSDNIISKTLTEDGSAISVSWTQVDIKIGPVTITRAGNENGVTFSAGVLEITPGSLTEDLSSLLTGQSYPVTITVYSASDSDGVVFAGPDSTAVLYFAIS